MERHVSGLSRWDSQRASAARRSPSSEPSDTENRAGSPAMNDKVPGPTSSRGWVISPRFRRWMVRGRRDGLSPRRVRNHWRRHTPSTVEAMRPIAPEGVPARRRPPPSALAPASKPQAGAPGANRSPQGPLDWPPPEHQSLRCGIGRSHGTGHDPGAGSGSTDLRVEVAGVRPIRRPRGATGPPWDGCPRRSFPVRRWHELRSIRLDRTWRWPAPSEAAEALELPEKRPRIRFR